MWFLDLDLGLDIEEGCPDNALFFGPKATDGHSRGETWPGLGLLYLEYLAYINQLTTLYALRSKRCLHFGRFDNKRVGFRPSGRGGNLGFRV